MQAQIARLQFPLLAFSRIVEREFDVLALVVYFQVSCCLLQFTYVYPILRSGNTIALKKLKTI